MHISVGFFMSEDTRATASDSQCLSLKDNRNAGPHIFFPSHTPPEAIRAIADAINAALAPAKVEEAADV
jgi:hypothetical protein